VGTTPTAKFDQGDRSSAIHWIVFDFLGGDYLTDGGVCGIDERSVLGDADCLLCITSLQRHVDKRVLLAWGVTPFRTSFLKEAISTTI
jgi:hypothetical protein